jgi:hypothetical protein
MNFIPRRFLGLALAALVVPSLALRAETDYRPFAPTMVAGDRYMIAAEALHPTQPAVGFREVAYKKAGFDRATAAEAVATLKKKNVPVVIGPGGHPFMTDGHHTIRALLESRQAEKTVYGTVLANWSTLPPAEFWAKMTSSNYAYLVDGLGRPLDYARLPASLREVQSDVYRGLAWAVMKKGGFAEREGVYFQEFFWGEYFRPRLKWNDADEADFQRALAEALKLAHAPEASKLPGYSATPVAGK